MNKNIQGDFQICISAPLSSILQQVPFQQTHSLFLGWLLIAQTQYQNMVEGWEEIPRQIKDLRSSRKLKKLVAI